MNNLFIGKVSKVLDLDLYTIEVDIPGYNEALPAFPKRGEVDEPRVGDVVLLTELDPLYKSYYLWEKLKENNFIGVRARGKVLKMSEEEVTLGIFDPSDTSWYDKNDGSDPTPPPTSWIKVTKDGTIDINAEADEKVVIAGNSEVQISGDSKVTVDGNSEITVSGDIKINVSGNASVEVSGNCDVKASGSCGIDSPDVKITGASLTVNGTAAPTGSGPFCGIPACIFSGAPHVGNKSSGN